jgi:hypothetical protein
MVKRRGVTERRPHHSPVGSEIPLKASHDKKRTEDIAFPRNKKYLNKNNGLIPRKIIGAKSVAPVAMQR